MLWLNSYPEENEATKGFYDSNKQRALTSLILCYFYDCKKGGKLARQEGNARVQLHSA